MPYIPPEVASDELSQRLFTYLGAPRHRGKVRDTYDIPGHPDKFLLVSTNRISIFDFVLNALVPGKGAVLTAMTVMWLTQVLTGIKHHLIAYGRGVDDFLPNELSDDPELQSRALVVWALEMVPIEVVFRAYLTGSGWTSYRETGTVCGIKLQKDLHDGAKLYPPIFTPTTKAAVGHDEHLDAAQVAAEYPGLLVEGSQVFHKGLRYAETCGILLADTKFEFGTNPSGELVLGDEVLTPDSSRFWLASDWEKASADRRSPSGYDKQPVREFGKGVPTGFLSDHGEVITGIQNLDPANRQHQESVGAICVPQEVTNATTARYREAFRILASMNLEEFQHTHMAVRH